MQEALVDRSPSVGLVLGRPLGKDHLERGAAAIRRCGTV
jgi:hypothetical protein